MARKPVPTDLQTKVLLLSRRRCCICFGLNRDTSIKQGQIAHLDGNAENNQEDNFAFLCLNHHDQYDGSTSQSKNFTIQEVKYFRDELSKTVREIINAEISFGAIKTQDAFIGHYIRGGEYESAEIKISRLEDGRYRVRGFALWGKTNQYGPHTGQIDFISDTENDSITCTEILPDNEVYSLHMLFSGNKLVAKESATRGMFGMNVTFDGVYEKAS